MKSEKDICKELARRVLVLDGAMGTAIQHYKLGEGDFRGKRFKDHPLNLKGNNDLLCLTRPDVVREIHEGYLEAGADIIETNTFNASPLSQADYRLESLVYEMNAAAARIAAEAAQKYTQKEPGKPRFVAGAIGPTGKTASISPDVSDPGFRAVTFDDMADNYAVQIKGLLDGGVDMLLIETVFDTLNARAALLAAADIFDDRGKRVPVMVSGTITDRSGRTLSGQTVEAFLISLAHFPLLSIGLNCSLGARELKPHLTVLAEKAPFYVSVHPNAGLPNQLGAYDQSPQEMAAQIEEFLDQQLVNIVGGCCGTTYEHIRRFARLATSAAGREIPAPDRLTRLSGLEPLVIRKESNFINIGERTNVSGSRKFARLIKEKRYDEALTVARQQVQGGAQAIDVSMDEAMLEAEAEMERFLNLIAAEPDIARVPVMIDSSKWPVIERGLKCLQGKGIVNSISLKEGEEEFIRRARRIRRCGAAAVVMAFDEQGQATTFERKIEVCRRSYDILTRQVQFPPEDIFLDPNVLTVATGLPEHDNYAVDFIRATAWIKENLPLAKVSGGVSNLSFSFRGNQTVREAMHAAFLYHAIKAGLDMGIVNAGALPVYDDIPPDLLELVEDVVLNRRRDAADRLVAYAGSVKDRQKKKTVHEAAWRNERVGERLTHALVHGIGDYLEVDVPEARGHYPQALDIIEGPLMAAMNRVGELFGAGKMFLPQVVKSARVMKRAVEILLPFIEEEKGVGVERKTSGKILLATVKGDVHDIGKNIVKVVLECNGFAVIDLGVMVPAEEILDTASSQQVDMVGVSGLITPSLDEMIHLAAMMEQRGLDVPLLIGGATTSTFHTAVKIAPHYHGPVVHVKDASVCPNAAARLVSPQQRPAFAVEIREKYRELRDKHRRQRHRGNSRPLAEARANKPAIDWSKESISPPASTGLKVFTDYPLAEIREYINWTFFFLAWQLKGRYPNILDDPRQGVEARKLFQEAETLLDRLIREGGLSARGVLGIFPAGSRGDDVAVFADSGRRQEKRVFHFLRNQQAVEDRPNRCLADFIAAVDSGIEDYIGAFAVTADIGTEGRQDDYSGLMLKIVADRLAEAFAELLHLKVRRRLWGYARDESLDHESLFREAYRGIRPAPGYPACPDHSEKRAIFDLLDVPGTIGGSLTENFMMVPAASVCGYYFAHPESRYFNVGRIGRDQVDDYARRKGMKRAEVEKWLSANLNYDPREI
jgi:5-methyltetrahydrofolate--homocysteine methyltransferase